MHLLPCWFCGEDVTVEDTVTAITRPNVDWEGQFYFHSKCQHYYDIEEGDLILHLNREHLN